MVGLHVGKILTRTSEHSYQHSCFFNTTTFLAISGRDNLMVVVDFYDKGVTEMGEQSLYHGGKVIASGEEFYDRLQKFYALEEI